MERKWLDCISRHSHNNTFLIYSSRPPPTACDFPTTFISNPWMFSTSPPIYLFFLLIFISPNFNHHRSFLPPFLWLLVLSLLSLSCYWYDSLCPVLKLLKFVFTLQLKNRSFSCEMVKILIGYLHVLESHMASKF